MSNSVFGSVTEVGCLGASAPFHLRPETDPVLSSFRILRDGQCPGIQKA
jgi:hypothetical protein